MKLNEYYNIALGSDSLIEEYKLKEETEASKESLTESQYCIYDKNKRACQLYDTYEDAEEALSYCDPEDGCYIKEVSDSEADYIENDLTDYDDEDDESFPVMIAGFGGDGDHYIYYIGYDNDKAMSTFDELKDDWVELGLGGGDTELAALEYTGDIAKFEEAIKAFEADPSNTIFDTFFTDDDVTVLDSVLDDPRKKLFSLFEQRRTKMKLIKRHLNEGMFDQAFYNTQEIIDNTTGKNKSFISRIAKHQEEKYGNVDIFEASLKYGEVRIGFGDYSLTFFFDNEGNIKDVIGNGQGKYQSSLEDVAKELYKKFGIENGFLGEE